MRYRKLDEAGDIKFGNQQHDFYQDNVEGVAQAVKTRLGLWVGEWFLDTNEGTPYEQSMLGKGKLESVEPALRERILGTEGVDEIVEFDLIWNADIRKIEYITTIDTVYGETELKGVL